MEENTSPVIPPEEESQPKPETKSKNKKNKASKDAPNAIDNKIIDQPQQKFEFHSLGIIQSCYKLKYSTPRQGSLCPLSRCKLTLHKHIPAMSLDGIEEYSHVWLIFIFHENDNKVFRSKISPPKLNGVKVGVFATRSPHRLNPIGMSLVKLDKRVGSTLYFSGTDLIEGTPIIDIKPIHAIEMNTEMKVAPWMAEQAEKRIDVEFSQRAIDDLNYVVKNKLLEFYDTYEEIYQAIYDTISLDPRETYVRKKGDNEAVWGFCFDVLNVKYRVIDHKLAHVVDCEYIGKDFKDYKKREAENPTKVLEGQIPKVQATLREAKREKRGKSGQPEEKGLTEENKFGYYAKKAMVPVLASVGLFLVFNWAKNKKL